MLLQIPGGVELIVILLIAILIFGIPLLLIGIVGALYLRAESDDGEDVAERVDELEAEIAALRAEIATDERADGPPAEDAEPAPRGAGERGGDGDAAAEDA
jgi:hypothetical protein